MKFGGKLFIVLIAGLFMQSIACAELLGSMSDETAKLPEQAPTVDETKSKIIYRVICSPEQMTRRNADNNRLKTI